MLYELTVNTIEGQEISLSHFRGHVLLVVNTASHCGFTSQYEGLQKLYQSYKSRHFSVLGFPSNDFLWQEPGSNEEIRDFCNVRYGVTFPLFEKAAVSGNAMQPVFKFLTDTTSSKFGGRVRWNFEKFLIGRDGIVRGRFRSFTDPSNPRLVQRLEELLQEPPIE